MCTLYTCIVYYFFWAEGHNLQLRCYTALFNPQFLELLDENK